MRIVTTAAHVGPWLIGLTVAVVASGTISGHGAFAYWLLGGYWVSLLTLIWQLRRLIVSAAKAQG